MHADWEQLMSSYTSDSSVLIASADCETQSRSPGTGKSLCTAENLRHYPFILYGKGGNFREYQGSRSFSQLKSFVESHKGDAESIPDTWAGPTLPTCPEEQAHQDRLTQIREIQGTPGVTWKAAVVPRFASEAPGASKNLLGVKGDWDAEVKAAIERGEVQSFFPTANALVPDSFDSAENWPQCAKVIGDIRDQSNCGCCWAFGGAEAASDRMCIATNASLLLPLSAEDVCFCASSDGCGGGFISAPWSHIKSSGAVTGGNYQGTGDLGKFCSDFTLPHCHHHGPQGQDPYPDEGAPGCPSQSSPRCPSKCEADAPSAHSNFNDDKYTFKGQTQSASGESGCKQMIMEGGPVEVAFTVYSDFENYAGGIYSHTTGGSVGGHAVKMVGWGEENGVKYWKVANSWNPYWGEKGYFRMKIGSPGGMDNQCVGSATSATWGKKSDLATLVV